MTSRYTSLPPIPQQMQQLESPITSSGITIPPSVTASKPKPNPYIGIKSPSIIDLLIKGMDSETIAKIKSYGKEPVVKTYFGYKNDNISFIVSKETIERDRSAIKNISVSIESLMDLGESKINNC